MSAVKTTVLTQDEVKEFEVLSRLAAHFRGLREELVEGMSDITGESPDEDGLTNTIAWDVIHNGDDLASVLRRCNLALPGADIPAEATP